MNGKELTCELLETRKHESGLVLFTTARVTDGETVKTVSFSHKSLPFTEDGVINALKSKFYEPEIKEPEIIDKPIDIELIEEPVLTPEEIAIKEEADTARRDKVDSLYNSFSEKIYGSLTKEEIDAVEIAAIEEKIIEK